MASLWQEQRVATVPPGFHLAHTDKFCMIGTAPFYFSTNGDFETGSDTRYAIWGDHPINPLGRSNGLLVDFEIADNRPLICITSYRDTESKLQTLWFGNEHFAMPRRSHPSSGFGYAEDKLFRIAGDQSKSYITWGDERIDLHQHIYKVQYTDGALLVESGWETERYITYRGIQYGPHHDIATIRILVADAKPLFSAYHPDNRSKYVMWGNYRYDNPSEIWQLDVVDDRPVLGGRSTAYWDTDIIGSYYCLRRLAGELVGKPVICVLATQEKANYSIYWGHKKTKDYRFIDEDKIVLFKDQLLYSVHLNDEAFAMIWGDQELPNPKRFTEAICVSDQAAFFVGCDLRAYHTEQSLYRLGDTLSYAGPCYTIKNLHVIGEIPIYTTSDRDKCRAFIGHESSDEYDQIYSLFVEDGQVVVCARNGRDLYRVTRTINQ